MKNFVAVESLRGWMAWWVVVGHAILVSGTLDYFTRYPVRLLPAGGLAVNVFMVISGFVITHMIFQKEEKYFKYLFRRAWRLLPLMSLMVLAALVVRPLYEFAYIANPWSVGAADKAQRFSQESAYWPEHLLAHITMLHGVLPDQVLQYASTTFLAPAWSISLEWQFYLVAPLLIAALTRRSFRGYIIAGAILAASAVTQSGKIGTWSTESFLPIVIPFFLVGMSVRLVFGWRAYKSQFPYQGLTVTFASLLLYAVGLKHDIPLFILQVLVVFSVCTLFFIIAAAEVELISVSSLLFRKISWAFALNPIIVALGRVSYSTYLCHIPVFSVIIGGAFFYGLIQSHESLIVWTAFAIGCTVPTSFACYHFIEKPAIALGRRMLRR